MILKKVKISDFHSIRDSNEFSIGDITCLVGKNEAGKTAVLEALRRLNPVEAKLGEFSITDDYPRRDVEDYRQSVQNGKKSHVTVVDAIFELEDSDISELTKVFGKNCIITKELKLSKGYSNVRTFVFEIDIKKSLEFLCSGIELLPDFKEKIINSEDAEDVLSLISSVEKTEAVAKLEKKVAAMKEGFSHYAYNQLLRPRVPQFLYFDEYHQMRGRDNIEQLKHRLETNTLQSPDYPLIGLVNLSRLKLDELLNPGRTQELKNRLEGAGNHLTKQIVKYWSQNKHLQMRFDVRPAQPQDPEGMRSGTNIWAEVYDSKHWVSTGLETRSRGFVWFFSFLAWYSDLKQKDSPLILLLDEPGLFLHAKAQEDLLNYFESELKDKHQLIYSTHSPFMVNPKQFDRIRIVQDNSITSDEDLPISQDGTKIISDVLEASGDSLFPLQGALGYELSQTLFVGPNSLVVEGVSDLLFIQGISIILELKKKNGLDQRWVITPVGGADKIPTFVALLGAQKDLNIAVLMDYQKKDQQTIENLYKRKLLKQKQVVTFVDFVSATEADIEDMFDPGFYIRLVNEEFATELQLPIVLEELNGALPRITAKLEEYFKQKPLKNGVSFNHYRPARYFLENVSKFNDELDMNTIERFSKCLNVLNSLL
ncbi:AAA family ATPase [Leptospira sp. FAT2]|uniref:AAA family ATPase n=1 Tax=Leptospira sanjuanensis TaxID=2879643 RepID=UPI001EE91791|nr:AAA family ATPase [Leptospira sanjuanensis]MCG6195504.1 AAA family ATPase [Leptospira sanjuanensis]